MIGKNHVFGITKPKPLKGFPDGKTRIRMRSNALSKVYVKTSDGVIVFTVIEKDGCWTPSHEMGRNQTV